MSGDEIMVTVEQGNGDHVSHWTIRPEPIPGEPNRLHYVCSGPNYGHDGFAFNDRADLDPAALALMAMLGPGLAGDELLEKYSEVKS